MNGIIESAKVHALCAHVPTCFPCLRAHAPTCLARLRAHVSRFPPTPMCSRANVPCALTRLCANLSCVLTWQRALRVYLLTCFACLSVHVL